ncbi:beta strand repeat-containing protein, partial [Pedobacter puniceum]
MSLKFVNIIKKLLIITVFILTSGNVFSQTATQANIAGSTAITPVDKGIRTVIDNSITVLSNGTISGAKVIISGGYISGSTGDILSVIGTLPSGITQSYNNTTGVMSLTGVANASTWQTVLRNVAITSTSASCYPEQRLITFSLGDKFYNPLTQHWYEASTTSSNWATAKANAASSTFFGKVGYLATLTSQAENNFIWKLMSSDAWVGGSDDYLEINKALGRNVFSSQGTSYNAASTTETEGKYYWVTGPEAGTRISNGNSVNGVSSVNGAFINWASGEPNNSGSEHYIQLYSANNGLWNDLPNGSSLRSVIEYGGSALDDNSSITIFTKELLVSGSASGRITGGGSVCSGTNSTTLTLTGYSGTVVRWESSADNFYTAGVPISNTSPNLTVSNLTQTTYYRAVVNTGTGCTALPTGSVAINVTTAIGGNISALNNSICIGGVVNLTLSGEEGNIIRWERKLSTASTWTSLTGTSNSFTESLSEAGSYLYRAVVQIPGCGSAVTSAEYPITVTSGTPPVGGSLNSLSSSTGNFSGTLTLTGNSGTIIKWQSSTSNGLIWTDINHTLTTYNFTGVNSTTLFRVLLQNGTCGTAYSSVGTVTIKTAPLISSPANVTKTFGDAAYTLTAPSSNSTGAFTYTSSNTSVATIAGNTVTIVGAGTTTITATQAEDNNYTSGSVTSTLTVSKVNPTIGSFANVNKTFGDAAYTLTAPTSNSSGAFTYSSSNTSVATIAGNTVTIVGAGTTTITATQAEDNNYTSGSVTSTLTVSKANPTIGSFANVNKTFGDAAYTITAPSSNSTGAFTYTSSDASVATVSGNTVTIVGAGTSTITATQAATTNYNSGTATSTLTVSKINPTIGAFANIAKNFGDASFSLTAPSSNSTGAFTYTSSDASVATVSGNTVTIVGAGTATITATQAATTNYNSGTATSTLTVNSINPTLGAFANVNKTFGDASFSLTAPTSNSSGAFTYSSSNTAVATVSGNTVTIVGAGTATITANQAATTNYNSGTATSTLTVAKANPTLGAFANENKTFGDGAFTLTAPTSNSSGAFTYSSSNTAVATVSGNTVTIVGAGTATITATQASTSNYNSATATSTLTVAQAAPTLSNFQAITKNFGDASFTLTAPTSNSSGAFTYSSSNTAVATVSGSTVTIVGAGTATITATQAATTSYSAGTITATLTVSKINPTIGAFANIAKNFGDASFSLTAPSSNSTGAFTYT